MATENRDDLAAGRPFASIQHEAQLAIVRTGAALFDAFERMLRPHGITATQYNVLRILRGAGQPGLCRNEIRDRLVSRMPDVTRLLDRMEDAGLISRTRSQEDRRLVSTELTAAGRRLVDSLDDAVLAEHKLRLGHLSSDQLRALIELLTEVRRNG